MNNAMKVYPYPVLGNGDDISGNFNLVVSPEIEDSNTEISVDFSCDNPTIVSLLNSGDATFVISIKCAKTKLRLEFFAKTEHSCIQILSNKIKDKVEVSGYICAKKKIFDYNPVGINPRIDLGPVDLEPGDILADSGTVYFIADKYFDPISAPTESLFKVSQGTSLNGPYTANFQYNNDQLILVEIPQDQYKDYLRVANDSGSHLIHSSIVLPVLVQALASSEYTDCSWYSRLMAICDTRGIATSGEPFEMAQSLISLPIERAINRFLEDGQNYGDEDE